MFRQSSKTVFKLESEAHQSKVEPSFPTLDETQDTKTPDDLTCGKADGSFQIEDRFKLIHHKDSEASTTRETKKNPDLVDILTSDPWTPPPKSVEKQ